MNNGISHSLEISKNNIVRKYNVDKTYLNDATFLAALEQESTKVNIDTEQKDNNDNYFLVENKKGICWIIKENNFFFLAPKKSGQITTHQFTYLKCFFEFKEYKENQPKKIILEEPAVVTKNGQYWRLESKGILNFGNNTSSSSSADLVETVDSQETREQSTIDISDKIQEIERLKKQNKQLREKLEELEQKQRENKDIQNRELHISSKDILESFKKEIINEISDLLEQKSNIDLESFKVLISKQESDRISQSSNINSESFPESIIKEISDHLNEKLNNKLDSFKELISKQESDLILQSSNINLESFQEPIINEISDRLEEKLNNELESFKELISKQESDRIPQPSNINSELFKQSIINDISDRLEAKLNHKLESFKELISNQESDHALRQFNDESADINKIISQNAIQQTIRDISSQEYSKELESLRLVIEELKDKISFSSEMQNKVFKENKSTDIRAGFSQEIIDQLNFLQKSISETNSKFPLLYEKLSKKHQKNIDDLSQESENKFNSIEKQLREFESTLNQLCKFIFKINQKQEFHRQEQQAKLTVDDIVDDFDETSNSTSNLLLFGETEYNEYVDHNGLSTHPNTSISKITNVQELINKYNERPGSLSNEVTKVAATEESIEKRRSGLDTPVIFTEDSNDSYWIVKELTLDNSFYLVPKANLIINNRNHQTIEDIFVCRGYHNRSSPKFKLSFPALVKITSDSKDEWELVEPGELDFA